MKHVVLSEINSMALKKQELLSTFWLYAIKFDIREKKIKLFS